MENGVCSICLDEISLDNCESLECNHQFCKPCIGKWRKSGASTCPMCRDEATSVRVYFSDSLEDETLVVCGLHRQFRNRICEPIFVYIEDRNWHLIVAPQTLLPELDVFFAQFQLARVQRHPCEKADAQPLSKLLNSAADETSFVLERQSTRGASEEEEESVASTSSVNSDHQSSALRELKQKVTNRLSNDARLQLIMKNNDSERSKTIFPVFCRMLEFEVTDGSRDGAQVDALPALPSLKESIIKNAVANGLQNPMAIIERFGEEWKKIADRFPRAEVEHVARATRNLAITSANADDEKPLTSDNEARSVILWNRLRNPICACCWRFDRVDRMRCCSRCESTFYCSEECQAADWQSHSHWCCNPNAMRTRGCLEMKMSPQHEISDKYVGAEVLIARPQFTAEMLQDALQPQQNRSK